MLPTWSSLFRLPGEGPPEGLCCTLHLHFAWPHLFHYYLLCRSSTISTVINSLLVVSIVSKQTCLIILYAFSRSCRYETAHISLVNALWEYDYISDGNTWYVNTQYVNTNTCTLIVFMLKMGPKYANTSILQYEYADFGSKCTSVSGRGGTYLPSLGIYLPAVITFINIYWKCSSLNSTTDVRTHDHVWSLHLLELQQAHVRQLKAIIVTSLS